MYVLSRGGTVLHPVWRAGMLVTYGLLTILSLATMSGCSQRSEESPILAIVNGKPINQSEFDYRWSELSDAGRARYDRQGGKKKFLD